ncbi:MAG: tripartite tricarboxylate transporter substrate binding protein [Rubrivivax sp.]
MLSRRHLLIAGVTATSPLAVRAQAWPARPVRIVVPYAPGGATDILGRLIAAQLQVAWGQQVLVENKPGASGVVGNDLVAKAPPDGYTVLLGITAIVQNASLVAKLPYDPYKDLLPVSQLATSTSMLSVSSKLGVKTLAEFVALVKSQPGKHAYGSFGNGSSAHIQGENFKVQAGLDLAHVPYKGSAPIVNDLLGGQLSAAFVDVGSGRAHVAGGGFRVLAVTGTERLKLVPDAPVLSELGYRNFEPKGWFGYFVPAGTPAAVVKKLAEDIGRAVRTPEVMARIEDLGLTPVGGTPEQFAQVIRTDGPLYARLIKELKITQD